MDNIQIPKSNSGEQGSITIEKNMIIVGSNGAGKTRFGSRLEQINGLTKRISAQRYLQLSEDVQKQSYEIAESQLRSSYKNQPSIQPQNDYNQVLVSLFAEESKRDSEYVTSARATEKKPKIPLSVKESVIEIWNFIFPHIMLTLEKDKVRATNSAGNFSGTEMSDGEKVGLYLISQILLADKDSILIIDEPELHLHKSLMVRLWNKLEECRNDCVFIYITHDLDFAVNKPSSKLVWIQSFKDNIWDWKEIDPNGVIPEDLYLEILGSRKHILFVEGDKSSIDTKIYQIFYEDFTIIPCGSCGKVIESVKGLKNHADLHDKKIYGLIDKDFRTDAQIAALKSDGIFSISLNEAENLFLLPEIIEIVCNHLNKTEKKEEIISAIRESYKNKKEQIGFAVSKYQMYIKLTEEFGKIKNQKDYESFKVNILAELDKNNLPAELPDENADIIDILKTFNNKGLVYEVQPILELTKDGYKNQVWSLSISEKKETFKKVLKIYLPDIK